MQHRSWSLSLLWVGSPRQTDACAALLCALTPLLVPGPKKLPSAAGTAAAACRYIRQYYTFASASQGNLVNAGCVVSCVQGSASMHVHRHYIELGVPGLVFT